MSSSKKKGSGLWAFLTQNNRKPTTFEVFVSIAKADYLLEKVYAIYRQQNRFENETKELARLRRIIETTHPDDPEYVHAKYKLYRLLKL